MLDRLARLTAFLLLALGLAGPAFAQSQCRIPADLRPVRATLPPPGKAVIAARTGHFLALSWSPQFCKENGDGKKHAAQCKTQRFGFILHGLWADGEGRNNPVWCKRVGAVPLDVLKKNFCATPSVGLMQHEWAKHGSCIAADPGAYFTASSGLYNALKFPDMDALSRSRSKISDFTTAFSRANPGLPENAIRVEITPLGWLEEVRICLDKDFRPRTCPGDFGGAGPDTALKIWRSGG
jgi:ribonuclease T2